METNINVWSCLAQFFLERNVFQKKKKLCTENQNTHFAFSNCLTDVCAIYEIMWKSTAEPDRPEMTIWHMRIIQGYS